MGAYRIQTLYHRGARVRLGLGFSTDETIGGQLTAGDHSRHEGCTEDILPKGTSVEGTCSTFLGTILTTVRDKWYVLGNCWKAIYVPVVNMVYTLLIFVWFYIHRLC